MSNRHGHMKGARAAILCPRHQATTLFVQAAPVQNTWYTILTTANARVYFLRIAVATTGETLEFRIVLDGVTITGSQAAVAGTDYYVSTNLLSVIGAILAASTSVYAIGQPCFYEGQNITIQIRKITAVGAGNITAAVIHARW